MTKALDAAVDAIHAMIDRCVETGEEFGTRDEVRAALRVALPAEPTPEAIEVMMKAIAEAEGYMPYMQLGSDAPLAAYRALRAHLLGESGE